MFDFLFGWRKASKCKRLMRQVQCRLVLLKNKRCSIVRQLRHDVVELLKLGHGQIAFTRAEQIYKDERIIEVYDLLEHFCEFIVINLAYIRRHKDCPNDINEAMSSLIFASARCGDIPELRRIRKLFGERYGQRLVMSALELLPNNLVNSQIRNNLSINSVAEDVKIRLVNEILRDSHPESSLLALEYNSEWHQKQGKEEANQQSSVKDDELLCITLPGATATMSTPADQHCSPIKALLPATQGPVKEDKFRILSTLSHTSDELVQCLEENMVYLDDIQEFQSPKSKDINLLDQRVFVFKSLLLTNKQKMDAVEKSKKTIGKVSNRRSRKRSLSREYWSFKDISYESYYGNKSHWILSNDMCKSTQRRKELKKNLEHSQKASNSERASSFDENNAETRLSTNCPKQGTIIPLGDEPSLSSNQSSYEVIDESETKESDFYSCSDCPSWRSISMPNERQETEHQLRFVRYSSLPVQRSSNENHIHPKLPDYKELELTFLALKNAYLLNKNH